MTPPAPSSPVSCRWHRGLVPGVLCRGVAPHRRAQAARAVTVAGALVRKDADGDGAVAQLRRIGGPRIQLMAAEIMARPAAWGYPHSRVHRLLLDAAGSPR